MRSILTFLAKAIAVVFFLFLLALGLVSCEEWSQQRPSAIAYRQQIEAERLPRKLNEAHGCEVWAFKPSDRWLYFTRCGAKTETTNTWDECRSVTTGKTTRTECTPRSAVISQEQK